jgi:hypothetical protein
MILFSPSVGVKENRVFLLCKKSGETRAWLKLILAMAAARYEVNGVTSVAVPSYSLRDAASIFVKSTLGLSQDLIR